MSTTAETCIRASFVDVCELVIRRPELVLPSPQQPVGPSCWRIAATPRHRHHARRAEWIVRLEPLAVADATQARLDATWSSTTRHRHQRPGHARLRVNALSHAPGACTQLTLAIEAPWRRFLIAIPAIGQRNANDITHEQLRAIASRIGTALTEPQPTLDVRLALNEWNGNTPTTGTR
jgi:hypothetical protein